MLGCGDARCESCKSAIQRLQDNPEYKFHIMYSLEHSKETFLHAKQAFKKFRTELNTGTTSGRVFGRTLVRLSTIVQRVSCPLHHSEFVKEFTHELKTLCDGGGAYQPIKPSKDIRYFKRFVHWKAHVGIQTPQSKVRLEGIDQPNFDAPLGCLVFDVREHRSHEKRTRKRRTVSEARAPSQRRKRTCRR